MARQRVPAPALVTAPLRAPDRTTSLSRTTLAVVISTWVPSDITDARIAPETSLSSWSTLRAWLGLMPFVFVTRVWGPACWSGTVPIPASSRTRRATSNDKEIGQI